MVVGQTEGHHKVKGPAETDFPSFGGRQKLQQQDRGSRTGGIAQLVEYLSIMQKALALISSAT